VEEDLAAELQKSISNVFTGKSVKRTDNFSELQKESKLFEACMRHKNKTFGKKFASALFGLLPPVASKHFRLQGAQKFLAV
jgi:hypothetical protein